MKSKQLLIAALKCKPIDRIPVVPHGYSEQFLRRYFDPQSKEIPLGSDVIYNPDLNLVEAQLAAHKYFGFDPLIWMTLKLAPCEWGTWADDWVIHKWDGLLTDTWLVKEELIKTQQHKKLYEYTIETPNGELKCMIEHEPGHTRWLLDNLIKNEIDIDLLSYRSDPEHLPIVDIVNAQLQLIGEEGVGVVHVPGVWHQACDLRGIQRLSYDLYDNPQWVKRFFGILKDYLVEFIKKLSTSDLKVLILNESHLGLGISASTFLEFVYQYDREIVDMASSCGLITIFHNCGRSNALLEGMANTGACAVETLAPFGVGGDVNLTDVKQRIGKQVCLRGGMDPVVIENGSIDDIQVEIKRCLKAAAKNGGYVLGPVSPIIDAPFENMKYLAEEVKRISYQYI